MPELPEVETIRRDLEEKIIGHKITAVEIRDRKMTAVASAVILTPPTRGKDPLKFDSFLLGCRIVKVERRGKLLAFLLSNKKYLLVHLKMTGQLIYREHDRVIAGGHKMRASDLVVPNNFTRVIFSFAGGRQLFFNDMRRFGYVKIVDAEEKSRIWENDFGIEPLTANFTWESFKKVFVGRKTITKALLMNQKLIAGIGNIYADEICFCARVLPWRRAGALGESELKKIFTCCTKVLQVAIKNRGTTFNDFVDSDGKSGGHYDFLNVYERDGEKCHRCKSIIKKARHAGRGTHFCEVCQK
ncbi:MAG: DNA-formamidopyrimidine glycosylase [Candidatus Magasanikbacteria bacterium RIFOXYA2_FULL_44_8]|uniref:DNA-formamidopyrimidine glycosylase n=1 Tax=Candidatus Magasanikbacteria bacterium RIFOXYA2_FULL_44_8 TaxID=1798696 RepID=A0A1F6NKX2_9BACT|nr:MAG: DNA-formamidopyrimidine glycosylase [Candidatus Magasanikbacteria bacterium RIFOXYA2_FULL_44_8]